MLSGPIQIEVVSFHIWQTAMACLARFTRCLRPRCRGRSQVALFRPDGPSMGLHHSALPLSPSGDHWQWKWRILKSQICLTANTTEISLEQIHTVYPSPCKIDIRYIAQWKCLGLSQYQMHGSSLDIDPSYGILQSFQVWNERTAILHTVWPVRTDLKSSPRHFTELLAMYPFFNTSPIAWLL